MNVYEQMVKKGYAVTNRKEEPKAATQEIPDEPVVVPEAKGKRGGVKTQQPMPEKPRPSIPRQKLKIFSDITESEVDICHKEITDEYAMIFVCDDSPVKIAAGKGKSLSIEHKRRAIESI